MLLLGAWLTFCRWAWMKVGSDRGSNGFRRWAVIGAVGWLLGFCALRATLLPVRRTPAADVVLDSIVWLMVGFPLCMWVAYRMSPPGARAPERDHSGAATP